MNRKQKVAVVVGVVVIVLLVLFPTWRVGNGDTDFDSPGWSYQYGHAWIGSPPENPFRELTARTAESLRVDSPDLIESYEQLVGNIPPVSIAWKQLIAHVVAALALTVAAVVVLKERKAGA